MLFEMVNENILLSNSVLRQSVILVTKDASNITQSDLQYAVTKIVTTVQCKLADMCIQFPLRKLYPL